MEPDPISDAIGAKTWAMQFLSDALDALAIGEPEIATRRITAAQKQLLKIEAHVRRLEPFHPVKKD